MGIVLLGVVMGVFDGMLFWIDYVIVCGVDWFICLVCMMWWIGMVLLW